MGEDTAPASGRALNRLAHCSSPYLRQHAHNPVDWYPWGPEALERARREDRPILLSIGYSACHWCHVMERESFENPEIAVQMNRDFVCIKVDREERPDLDAVYIQAVQALTGRAGWPLTVFLTPDLAPFFGGTYFPPEDRGEMPGLPRILRAVRKAFDGSREEVERSARSIADVVRATSAPARDAAALSSAVLDEAVRGLATEFDARHGGFGPAPKFHQAPVLDLLLRLWAKRGQARVLDMLTLTLERMAAGGIRDHVGGGFHRYSTDAMWRVPHFEKMLYDNALLAALYADAARAFRRDDYRSVAEQTADYMLRDLRGPDGGFYAAQDADSEGVEGAYYAWTHADIMEVLGEEDGAVFARCMDATKEGNWTGGTSVLHRTLGLESLAGLFGIEVDQARRTIAEGIEALREVRGRRVPPATDTKVLTDWNGLAISALVSVHRATGRADLLSAARGCAEFILRESGGIAALVHCRRKGEADVPALLSDSAMLAAGLLDLCEATFDAKWLDAARELAEVIVADHWDEEGGAFRDASSRSEELFAPVRMVADQPLPSGAAVATHVLLRYAALTGESRYAEVASRAVEGALPLARRAPSGLGHMLAAALRCLSPPREFVIVAPDRASAAVLRRVADEFYVPHLVQAGADARDVEARAGEIPLLTGRRAVEGRPTAYLCSGGTCREPVQDAGALRAQFEALRPAD